MGEPLTADRSGDVPSVTIVAVRGSVDETFTLLDTLCAKPAAFLHHQYNYHMTDI